MPFFLFASLSSLARSHAFRINCFGEAEVLGDSNRSGHRISEQFYQGDLVLLDIGDLILGDVLFTAHDEMHD